MKTWAYRVLRMPLAAGSGPWVELEDKLNELGAAGWEVVGIAPEPLGTFAATTMTVLLKLPL